MTFRSAVRSYLVGKLKKHSLQQSDRKNERPWRTEITESLLDRGAFPSYPLLRAEAQLREA